LNPFQSAYRAFHNTETALLTIFDDVYRNIDNQKITLLVGLDLSAAFDTLEHSTLLNRLKDSFGVSGAALGWLDSYLDGRKQFVKVNDARSTTSVCDIGVPQGSVLGPILFSLFVAPIAHVIESFGVSLHQYADDTQLYIGISPGNAAVTADLLNGCTDALQRWFTNNGLCLNPSKSELLLIGRRQRLKSASPEVKSTKFNVAGCPIEPSVEIKS